jgi:hypothetical protein
MPELRAALDAVGEVDVLGLKMCLMGMAEVATEAIGHADYMVARESVGYSSDWNWAGWLNLLVATPDASARDVANKIVTTYRGSDNVTLSNLDMAVIPNLNNEIDTFASYALDFATPSDWQLLAQEAGSTQVDHFDPYESYRDLAQYMDAVSKNEGISALLRSQALDVYNAVVAQTVVSRHGVKGRGLSIYLPPSAGSTLPGYNSNNLTFLNMADPNGTRWGDFVLALVDPVWRAILTGDWGETAATAPSIGASACQPAWVNSGLGSAADVDFFALTASAGQVLYVQLFGSPVDGGLAPLLTVYAPNGTTVLAQAVGDEDGVATVSALPLSQGMSQTPLK